MYFDGLGVSQDYLKAINWFLKSASQGNERAMANVGVVFYQIYGESDDYMKSLKWFHKAGGKYYISQVGRIFDKKWQGQVHIINYTEGMSTTGILEKFS